MIERATFCVLLSISLGACISSIIEDNGISINKFDSIEQNLGQNIEIEGYISLSHEATGLYLRKSDLIKENDNCLVPKPFGDYDHGQRVRLTGLLVQTDCGTTRVCTNVCSTFEVHLLEQTEEN